MSNQSPLEITPSRPRYFTAVAESVLDPIMRLDEMFRADAHSDKINLVVGVYQTDQGTSPVLDVVKEAERRLVGTETSKVYIPMTGEKPFLTSVEQLIFGDGSALLRDHRVASVHAPGGTAALRLAAEFIAEAFAGVTVWIGDPAYPNHRGIFGALGITCKSFRYFDPMTAAILEDAMYADLDQAKPGDIVLVHGCCHNPSGADLTPRAWQGLARFLADRDLVPFIDLAYLGYAAGLDQDAHGMRTLFEHCPEGLVTTSFSKNFSLYNERAGVLSYVAGDATTAERCASRTRTYIRRLYSSPPAHGGRIVATVLCDPVLREQWKEEVEAMRQRMIAARQRLHDALSAHQVNLQLVPGLTTLKGMFALTRLTEAQVLRLRDGHHIYMLPNGRISITGLISKTMDRLAGAIAEVAR